MPNSGLVPPPWRDGGGGVGEDQANQTVPGDAVGEIADHAAGVGISQAHGGQALAPGQREQGCFAGLVGGMGETLLGIDQQCRGCCLLELRLSLPVDFAAEHVVAVVRQVGEADVAYPLGLGLADGARDACGIGFIRAAGDQGGPA